MNILTLSLAYIRQKKLNTLLNTVLLSLGVGLIIFLLQIQYQLEEKFYRDIQGIKMVIGAKGSPLQLILCNVYHIDLPTGNISLKDANTIAQNQFMVKSSIPLALGDNYEGYRIVGTTYDYPTHYQCKMAEGRLWEKTMEVTIGSEVAQEQGLKVGDSFAGAHGLIDDPEMDESLKHQGYKVVGIMQSSGTVLDRLILTSIVSVWAVHEDHGDHETHEEEAEEDHPSEDIHHAEEDHPSEDIHHAEEDHHMEENDREITALLITEYRNPLAAINLPRLVASTSNLQSASPALQISRLFELIGIGEQALRAFAFIIIFIATLSIFIALFNALRERQYDLAIMRTLGASSFRLFSQIILEGLILASFGAILGLFLGHWAIWRVQAMEAVADKITLDPLFFLESELWVFFAVLGVGVIAAILPALQVYRMDISKTLSS